MLDIYLNFSHGLIERSILAQNERSEPEVCCWKPQSTYSIHLTASQTHAVLFLKISPRQLLLKESYCISGTDSKAQYSVLILFCPLMQHSELEHLRTADLGHTKLSLELKGRVFHKRASLHWLPHVVTESL